MSHPGKPPAGKDSDPLAGVVPIQPAGCPTAGSLTRAFTSKDLFGGAKTVLIEHNNEQYRLIITKNGKLLLQK